jgi:hypothetical protein
MSLERRMEIQPAFDRRNQDPKKNYGIHCCDLSFYLLGKRGAVQFKVFTGWYLPHVANELEGKPYYGLSTYPKGYDIGYHAREPQYEGQTLMTDDCPLIGGPCYYDGSSLQAESIAKALVEEGSEAVWKIMEQRYIEQFGDLLIEGLDKKSPNFDFQVAKNESELPDE